MITVGRGAIATYIDPRVPGAHDHITFQRGLAGDGDRGAVDRLSHSGERHAETEGKRRNSQKSAGNLQTSTWLPVTCAVSACLSGRHVLLLQCGRAARAEITGSARHALNNRNLVMRRASPVSASKMAVVVANQIPRAAAKTVGSVMATSGTDAGIGTGITISELQRIGLPNWHRG